MKLKIVAVRDIIGNVFHPPVFMHNIGSAIRSFGDNCRNKEPGNLMGQHPEDFELYELGEYDDQNAHFETDTPPRQIAVGANYREQ